jgi:uncharacterized protein (DUF362 family)/Pyruvate/2-oxoacid:ferredoxin oxidoreductase delta subunit
MQKVILNTSENYRLDRVIESLEQIFDQMGGIENIIKPGMKVVIKPNLFTARKPEDAATTHPAVVRAVTEMVQKAGGIVNIAESPGGPYNTNYLKRIYTVTGIEEVANETGAELNYDLRVEKIENPQGKIVKSLKILKPLVDADLIINIAKLKTHGMMVFTGAVKNMFGSIAGLEKAEFHLRMSDYDRFADSLIDIFLASKPKLNIIDGITAMEGEGPGAGVPKYLGAILVSNDAFACDYAALKLIGVDYHSVPVLKMAEDRGLFQSDQVEIVGVDPETIKPDSFDVPALKHTRPLERNKFLGFFKNKLRPHPEIISDKCRRCGKCAEVCPPKAISADKDNKMTIDYKKCISCLCCHEFCPEKAVKIRKNVLRKLLEYRRVHTTSGS